MGVGCRYMLRGLDFSASVDIVSSLAVEEQTVRAYKAEQYYPVQTGHSFQDRYRVVGMLELGPASIVWLS